MKYYAVNCNEEILAVADSEKELSYSHFGLIWVGQADSSAHALIKANQAFDSLDDFPEEDY